MSRLWISAAVLAEVIGKDNARLLGLHFGGVGQYIPQEAAPGHPFAPIIGMDAMIRLCAAWGGEYVNLPNYRKTKSRKADALRHLEAGRTPKETARDLALTERYVQYLAAEARRDNRNAPAQLPLLPP